MFWRIIKNNSVALITQKHFPTGNGFKNAMLALLTKTTFDLTMAGDKPNNAF